MILPGKTVILAVHEAWAKAVGAKAIFGSPPGGPIGGGKFQFLATVAGIHNPLGLWVTKKKEKQPAARQASNSEVFIPWSYICSVVTNPSVDSQRPNVRKAGFR